jgi:hypothetical protein
MNTNRKNVHVFKFIQYGFMMEISGFIHISIIKSALQLPVDDKS